MANSYGIPDDAVFTKSQLMYMLGESEERVDGYWAGWGTDANDRLQHQLDVKLGSVSTTKHFIDFLERTDKALVRNTPDP